MLELHLEIDSNGSAVFRAESPRETGEVPRVLTGNELLLAARAVLWYKEEDGFESVEDDCIHPTIPNLLMFLSDVRVRRFKQGVFLAPSVLRAAEVFRVAAAEVAAGRYLPGIEERNGRFYARWRPVVLPKSVDDHAAFYVRCVDGLARRAQRTALEDGSERCETVHDAWLKSLRTDAGVIAWKETEDVRDLMRVLDVWRSPLIISAAERAALKFHLIAPHEADAPWHLKLGAVPKTRMGLISLGQAAAIFPPIRSLHGCVAELSRADAENFLRTGAQALTAAGFDVDMPCGVTGEHVTAEAELTPGDGNSKEASKNKSRSIATKLTIRVDGEKVTEREIQFLLDQGSTLVFFRDRWIEVDRFVLREALRALQSVKGKKLDLHQAVSFAIGMGRVGRLRVDRVKAHGWLRGLLNELRGDAQFKVLPAPKGLNGELRDYQLRGASWLTFLTKWGFGPCLADDMGLGKTIQTIAYVLHLRNAAAKNPNGADPVLVVAPVSVTTNWMREFRKFAPKLKVMLHQGATRATGGTFLVECRRADVVITGYSLLVKDFRDFSGMSYSALILDEAQMIKNADTRVARAARALEIPIKVALTGTPFENSANDLWSIEEFLNPGLLGERKDFEMNFTKSIRENAHSGAATKLKHILEPFMLRRLKTDPGIASELGEKREIREYCVLSQSQRRAYEDALTAFRNDVASDEPSRGRVLALLTELKLICDGEGKLARLDELLEEIFASGESCLIFTQYAKVGRMLRSHLQEQFGRLFPFLHGGLSPAQRDGEISAFNADTEPNAFILSLKAGGFGLNLTRATHVIHFDRWWNPAVENQATDRAHRIGQKKTVFVHAFICAGTLEDHVDELLESKRYLANEVVAGGEGFLLQMNAKALERVVSLE